MTKRDFLALEDWSTDEVDALLVPGRAGEAGRDRWRARAKGAGDGVHGPEPSHPHQLRDRHVPPRRPRGGAGAGQGKLVPGDRAGRGDGRRHRGAHRRCGSRAGPVRRRAGRPLLSPRPRLGHRAPRRDRSELRPALREAGDQSRVGPPPPVSGAGRCHDPPREAGRDLGQALRPDLGLASQGTAHRRARERRARRGPARHGDRDRPAPRIRARPGGHGPDPPHRPGSRRRIRAHHRGSR